MKTPGRTDQETSDRSDFFKSQTDGWQISTDGINVYISPGEKRRE